MKSSVLTLRHRPFIVLITLVSMFMTTGVYAQSNLHQQAEQFAQSGDITNMGETYQRILKENPGDMKAKLGYATALSWSGNHIDAQAQFKDALKQQPDNLEALIGLGYDHAWAGQYHEAEIHFLRAQSVAPDNLGAHKGIGFTYLWNKQSQHALETFQGLDKKYPNDPEILAALGQAQLELKQYDEAEASFQMALTLSPDRNDARDGLKKIHARDRLKAIQQRSKGLDLSAWVGDTSNGGDTGVREIIVGYWINDDVRTWFRYDNSLSLDNPALVRSGSDAETYYFGALSPIDKNWNSTIEIGFRDLPNNSDQKIFKAEAVRIQDSKVLKLGAQLSPHSENYTDKLIFAAYGYPINERWRLEPSLYLSTSGAIDDQEWRTVMFAEYLAPTRWSIGVSAGVGDISSDNAAAEGTVFNSNVLFSYPMNQKNRLNLSVRYEDSPSTSYTTMLVGIALQL